MKTTMIKSLMMAGMMMMNAAAMYAGINVKADIHNGHGHATVVASHADKHSIDKHDNCNAMKHDRHCDVGWGKECHKRNCHCLCHRLNKKHILVNGHAMHTDKHVVHVGHR